MNELYKINTLRLNQDVYWIGRTRIMTCPRWGNSKSIFWRKLGTRGAKIARKKEVKGGDVGN